MSSSGCVPSAIVAARGRTLDLRNYSTGTATDVGGEGPTGRSYTERLSDSLYIILEVDKANAPV